MQIDPAALSRTDSHSAKSAAPNASSTAKSSRALISVPRLDLEPAYTDLKAAIGDKWAEYKESTALFLLGMGHCASPFAQDGHLLVIQRPNCDELKWTGLTSGPPAKSRTLQPE